MYRIDHTLSTEKNLVNLANTAAQYPLGLGDFELANFANLTPNTSNQQSNTSATLRPVEGSRLNGEASVRYTRFTLAENRPSVGNTVVAVNGDTHENIQDRILERHQLVREEIIFTNPVRTPVGGEALNYTLNPRANSPIYRPGALVISARNLGPLRDAHPSYFFGNPVGQYNDKDVYLLPVKTYSQYASNKISKRQAFLNLVNLSRTNTARTFDATNLTLGVPVAGTLNGQVGNTYVSFDPLGEDSPIGHGAYFLYSRVVFNAAQVIATNNVDAAYYAGLENELLYSGMMIKRNLPKDEFSFNRVFATADYRRVEFQQVNPPYTTVTNPVQMTFDVMSPD